MSANRTAAAQQVEACLRLVATAVLAVYPWLAGFGLFQAHWRVWLAALGAHALWIALRPAAGAAFVRSTSALCLAGILGAAFPQLLVVYARIVKDYLGLDYYLLASLIRGAATNPAAGPVNIWFYPAPLSLLQIYLDPVTPLVSRVFDLTHDPFRLLAYHSAMVLSAPILVWCISGRQLTLRAFQLLLPVALLVYPAVVTEMASDYHESEVAMGLLLLGTYWFFLDRGKRGRSFAPLLLGTLIKISYWPSWLMFGVISAFRRQWRWTGAYVGTGAAALLIHQLINRGSSNPGLAPFLGGFGTTPFEIARSLVIHPQLWLQFAAQPSRWIFFVALLLPLGVCVLAYPLALVPALPLAAFSLLDASGIRASVPLEYATEYLGYIVGGSLVGIAVAPRWARIALLAMLGAGATLSVSVSPALTFLKLAPPLPAELMWTNMNVARARASEPGYVREAAFAACAVGAAPVLATSYHWITYDREFPDQVWVDDASSARAPGIPAARWDAFETLTAPHDPLDRASFGKFPTVAEGYDRARYQQLFDRLKVHVLTSRGWDYWGGPRLDSCAERYGFEVTPG